MRSAPVGGGTPAFPCPWAQRPCRAQSPGRPPGWEHPSPLGDETNPWRHQVPPAVTQAQPAPPERCQSVPTLGKARPRSWAARAQPGDLRGRTARRGALPGTGRTGTPEGREVPAALWPGRGATHSGPRAQGGSSPGEERGAFIVHAAHQGRAGTGTEHAPLPRAGSRQGLQEEGRHRSPGSLAPWSTASPGQACLCHLRRAGPVSGSRGPRGPTTQGTYQPPAPHAMRPNMEGCIHTLHRGPVCPQKGPPNLIPHLSRLRLPGHPAAWALTGQTLSQSWRRLHSQGARRSAPGAPAWLAEGHLPGVSSSS